MEQEGSQIHMSILKELSDIKSGLAVNNSETANIKARVSDIQDIAKETKNAVQIQNGRVRTLEDWSVNAQKMIESTTTIASNTLVDYRTDKTRIWAVVGVMLFLGGSIIALSIMAIDSKIKEGIQQALSDYQIEIK